MHDSGLELEPAYVLHTRAYRNTSLIVELFTPNHGRVGAVARAARAPKSKTRGLLQAFTPIMISFRGGGDLVNLRNVEGNGLRMSFTREHQLSAFYLNELVMNSTATFDPHRELYYQYEASLQALAENSNQEMILRHFERYLLQALGYEFNFYFDADNSKPITAEKFYRFMPEHGFVACAESAVGQQSVFVGASILALADDELNSPGALRDAKRLMRLVFAVMLGKNLRSREMMQQYQRYLTEA